MVRSFAKVQNRTRAKIIGDDAREVLAKKYEDARRRQHTFLRKLSVEEIFIGKSLGIDSRGRCIRHQKELVCKVSQLDSNARDHETMPPIVNTCRVCRLEASQGGCRPAIVNVIGEVRELESDTKEWKGHTVETGNKNHQRNKSQLNDDYDGESSSDIDSEDYDEDIQLKGSDELPTEANDPPKESEWIKFLRSRIEQVSSWEDRLALKNHHAMCHYFRMLQSGVPVDVVKVDVEKNGYHSSIVDLEPDLPLERQLGRLGPDALENLRSMGMLTDNGKKDVEDIADEDLTLECHGDSEEAGIENGVKKFFSVAREHGFTLIYVVSSILDVNEYARQQIEKISNHSDETPKTANQTANEIHAIRSLEALAKGTSYGSIKRSSETLVKRKPRTSMKRNSTTLTKRRSETSLKRNSETSTKDISGKTCSSLGTESSDQKDQNRRHENRQRKRKSSSSGQRTFERQGSMQTTTTIDTSGHEYLSDDPTSRTENRSRSNHSENPVENPAKEHNVRRKLKAVLSPAVKPNRSKRNHKIASKKYNGEHPKDKEKPENTIDGQRATPASPITKTTAPASKVSHGSKKSSPKHKKRQSSNFNIPMAQEGAMNSKRNKASQSYSNPSAKTNPSQGTKKVSTQATADGEGEKNKYQTPMIRNGDKGSETSPNNHKKKMSMPKKNLTSVMKFSRGTKTTSTKPLGDIINQENDTGASISNDDDSRNKSGKSSVTEKVGSSKKAPVVTVKKKKFMTFFQRAKQSFTTKTRKKFQYGDNEESTGKSTSKDPSALTTNLPSTEFFSSVSSATTSSLIKGGNIATTHLEFNPIDGTSRSIISDPHVIPPEESLDAFIEETSPKNSPTTSFENKDKIEGIRQEVRDKEQTINDLLRQELKRRDGVIDDLRRQINEMNESVERRRGSMNSRKEQGKVRRDSMRDSNSSKTKSTNIKKLMNSPIADEPKRENEKTTSPQHSKKKTAVPSKRDDSRKRRSATSRPIEKKTANTSDDGESASIEGMNYELVLLDCIHKLRNIEDVELEDEYEFDWRSR